MRKSLSAFTRIATAGVHPGIDGKGITELEYDWATERGIPRLCFVIHKDHPWAASSIEFDAKPKLDAFKARVQERVVGFFTTPDNLARQVIAALSTLPQVKQLSEPEAICNFVPKPDRFVGRGDELAALNSALSTTSAVAITAVRGIGGIGKSIWRKPSPSATNTLSSSSGRNWGRSRATTCCRAFFTHGQGRISRPIGRWIASLARRVRRSAPMVAAIPSCC